MARISLPDPATATGELKEIFDEIEKAAGKVGNIWRAYGVKPALLRATWERRKALMTRGELRGELREGIALAVSEANGCEYCIQAHTRSLARFGASPERIEALRYRRLEDPAEKALLDYAVKVSTDPHGITDEEVENLRRLGYSDVAIVEATAIADHYTAMNKFLDALAVEWDG